MYDEAFINDINSFDSTALITEKAIVSFKDTTYYIIVIESHDSIFNYCGSGPFFKLYYDSKEIGSKVRSLHYN